jgi:hypothetical protein
VGILSAPPAGRAYAGCRPPRIRLSRATAMSSRWRHTTGGHAPQLLVNAAAPTIILT